MQKFELSERIEEIRIFEKILKFIKNIINSSQFKNIQPTRLILIYSSEAPSSFFSVLSFSHFAHYGMERRAPNQSIRKASFICPFRPTQ